MTRPLHVLRLALSASVLAAVAPAASAACPDDALGTSRTLVLPREGAAYGRAQHGPLPLAPREVVLTFDDGPRPETTPQVLQALRVACTHATFFMNGEPMLRHPALARQVQAEGHTVAMHGYRHDNFTALAPAAQLADLQAMREAHRSVLGGEPAAWRYPFLGESEFMRSTLREQRITTMSVDVGVEDWVPVKAPEVLADRLIERLRASGGGIVLLHDAQEQTAAALPLMLRRLKDDGWRVVRLQWSEH